MPFRLPLWDKFPVDVILLQKRGKGLIAVKERARFLERSGSRYYELKKSGTKFQPVSFDSFIPLSNGKPFTILYEYERDHVVPVTTADLDLILDVDNGEVVMLAVNHICDKGHNNYIEEDDKDPKCEFCGSKKLRKLEKVIKIPKVKKAINLHTIPENRAFWGQVRRWRSELRHKQESWIQRNKELIMMSIVFVFFIIMSYLFMNNISESTADLTGALERLAVVYGANPPPG